MRKYSLEVIVFITGAVVMVLELVGSRIVAPYAGTSIVVWTSLIGIILGSLSVGYFLGGKYADKGPNYKKLGNIILLAALLIGIISFVKPFAVLYALSFSDLRISSIILTTILFAPSSLVLGMIPTYSVRIRIESVKTSGTTIGRLYSISTIGSIFGTFITGFYLISILGSQKIIILLSVVLFITSLVAFWANIGKKIIAVVLVIFLSQVGTFIELFMFKRAIVEEKDSLYNKIMITSLVENATGRPMLALITGRIHGPTSLQTSIYLDGEYESASPYTRHFAMAEKLTPTLNKALLIGGGGYAYPREFLMRNPEAEMDVIEIDPTLTALAYKYFKLKDDPRINIYHQDGRNYLEKNKKKYDLIAIDVFSGDSSIPFHLTTFETMRKVKDSLNSRGIVLMNVISAIDGESGKYLRAQVKTFKKVFGNVYIFPVNDVDNPKKAQNIVVVAVQDESFLTSISLENGEIFKYLYDGEIVDDVPYLTDDFAPVDQYYVDIEKALFKPS